ncbi:MAG: hypothetical protein ACI406_17335 [Victivallis vadensis]
MKVPLLPKTTPGGNPAAARLASLRTGEEFNGYQLLDDGMETGHFRSFRVIHIQLGARRILRILKPDSVERAPEVGEQFLERCGRAARIDSSALLRIFEATTDRASGLLYAVLDFPEAQPLEEYGNFGFFTPAETVSAALTLAEAIAALDAKLLSHGNISAHTLLIGDSGFKLAGFESAIDEVNLRIAGGSNPDIRNAGALLFRMLTGVEPPKTGRYAGPDVRKARSDVPGPLALLIMRMLSGNSAAGFGSVTELLFATRKLAGEFPPELPDLSPNRPRRNRPQLGRLVPRLSTLYLIAALLLLSFALFGRGRREFRRWHDRPRPEPVLSEQARQLQQEQARLEADYRRLKTARDAWRIVLKTEPPEENR